MLLRRKLATLYPESQRLIEARSGHGTGTELITKNLDVKRRVGVEKYSLPQRSPTPEVQVRWDRVTPQDRRSPIIPEIAQIFPAKAIAFFKIDSPIAPTANRPKLFQRRRATLQMPQGANDKSSNRTNGGTQSPTFEQTVIVPRHH